MCENVFTACVQTAAARETRTLTLTLRHYRSDCCIVLRISLLPPFPSANDGLDLDVAKSQAAYAVRYGIFGSNRNFRQLPRN